MLYDSINKRIPINKGWSGDRKYCALDDVGNKFLLRIADISQLERKHQELEYMGKIDLLGLPICKPLEVGMCEEGVYSIQSWIEGKDMYDCIDGLSDMEIYNYGYMSGQILKKMHSIPAPAEREDWARY
ncbi:MAG: phosphotransferase, partial [Clostridia bacterium]|nr:phosphotransferase [Clostridia bacterium]